MKTMLKSLPVMCALTAVTLLVSGCGKKSTFVKQEFSATAVASQYTKPKIDILFVQDNSPSMQTPIQNLKGQLDGFLNGMDARWDIHFTVMPLQSQMSFASKWIVAEDCSTISQGNCVPMSQRAAFNNAPAGTTYAWINTIDQGTGNFDEGFKNTKANLAHASATTTKFLRPDAALAVVVLTNGEDVSGVTQNALNTQPNQCWYNGLYHPELFPQYDYCDFGDGRTVPNPYSQNLVNSYNSFKNYVTTTLKGGGALTRFYGVVARNNYSNCYDGPTWQGSRYMNMANDLGGNHYELCDGGLSSVLANIRYQLDSLVEAYRFNYAVVDASSEPIQSSITVKKNGAPLPQSTSNGWSYVGFKSNQPISYYPQPSNFKTGFMIKLNGSAEYSGTDVITIDFQKK